MSVFQPAVLMLRRAAYVSLLAPGSIKCVSANSVDGDSADGKLSLWAGWIALGGFEIALHQRCRVSALGIQRSFVEDRRSNIFVCHHLHLGLISRCLPIPCCALARISAISGHQQVTPP